MQRTARAVHRADPASPRWIAVLIAAIIGSIAVLTERPLVPHPVTARSVVSAAAPSAHRPADAVPAHTTRPPMVARWRLTVAQRELIAWAFDRFRAAGLEVPRAGIVFSADSARCGGHPGRFRTTRNVVQICARDEAPEPTLRWLVLHELAHAWEHATLGDDDRERFRTHRGATTWSSMDVPWPDRATEHAAEVIAWGLFDRPLDVRAGGDTSPAALGEAFELLTGTEPINDGSHPSADPTAPPARATPVVS